MLGWLPRYSPGWLQLDLIAGVTVGITVVPQALAYAEVAGLPPQVGVRAPGRAGTRSHRGYWGQPHAWGGAACAWAGGGSGRAPSAVLSAFVPAQYGLYSSFVGCFVYCFLGTAKDVTLGPTAIMSLLVSSYAFHDPVYAVLLTFLSGCIQLAMGLLHLGEMLLLHTVMFWGYALELLPALCSLRCWGCPANACDSSVCVQPPHGPQQGQQCTYCPLSRAGFLLDFISCPVIKGFTSAASITISFNQVKVGAADLLHAPRLLSPGAG